jgi:hypothetical protein
VYGWLRNPYSESSAQPENLILKEVEELCELQSDRTLTMRFTVLSLDTLWISMEEEYPAIHRKAVDILLQFSTLYICEQAFSCLTNMKNKIEIVSFQLKVNSTCPYLKFRPELSICAAKKQAQVLH